VLLWICGQDSAPVNEGKSLEMGVGRRDRKTAVAP
jgi:hypothetical protein